MSNIFSQGRLSGASQQSSVRGRGKKRRGFRPPLKEGGSVSSPVGTQDSLISSSCEPLDTEQSGRVGHTVLSYCGHEGADDEHRDTQQLSMFSGERVRDAENTCEIGELDDPFSLSHSSEYSKLDDPLSKLDDPLSLSSDSQLATLDPGQEQRVPGSPTPSRPSDNEEEMEVDSGRGGIEEVPRRCFKPRSNSRCYNLDLLPQHYRERHRKNTNIRHRGKPSVNWASDLSVVMRSEGGAGDERPPLSVYEVPLSAEETGRRERDGETTRNTSRESRSNLSKLDLSISTRTKEQQLLIDSEVLIAISQTRDEIRDLRARYLAMTSSGQDKTSLIQYPKNETSSTSSQQLRPQLQVYIV